MKSDLEFKVRPKQSTDDRQVVELWTGDLCVATLHPYESGFRVSSDRLLSTEIQWGRPPSVLVTFRLDDATRTPG